MSNLLDMNHSSSHLFCLSIRSTGACVRVICFSYDLRRAYAPWKGRPGSTSFPLWDTMDRNVTRCPNQSTRPIRRSRPL